MAWKQTDLEAIETAIKQGVLRVRYSDREVTYRSLDELERTRAQMMAEMGMKSPRPVLRRTSYSKDLG